MLALQSDLGLRLGILGDAALMGQESLEDAVHVKGLFYVTLHGSRTVFSAPNCRQTGLEMEEENISREIRIWLCAKLERAS